MFIYSLRISSTNPRYFEHNHLHVRSNFLSTSPYQLHVFIPFITHPSPVSGDHMHIGVSSRKWRSPSICYFMACFIHSVLVDPPLPRLCFLLPVPPLTGSPLFLFHITYILLAFPASLKLPPIMATFLPLWPIPSRIHVYNLTLGSIQGREQILSFHVWATLINILISWPIHYPENFLFLYSQIKCLYLHYTSCPFTSSWITMQTSLPGG